jgi:hypothetical protein
MFLGSRARPAREADRRLWTESLDNVEYLTSNNSIGLHGLLLG